MKINLLKFLNKVVSFGKRFCKSHFKLICVTHPIFLLRYSLNKTSKLMGQMPESKYLQCELLESVKKCGSFLIQLQKQSYSGVLWKRCSENMQQTYRRTPMPKCDFNKVIALRHRCFLANFMHIGLFLDITKWKY